MDPLLIDILVAAKANGLPVAVEEWLIPENETELNEAFFDLTYVQQSILEKGTNERLPMSEEDALAKINADQTSTPVSTLEMAIAMGVHKRDLFDVKFGLLKKSSQAVEGFDEEVARNSAKEYMDRQLLANPHETLEELEDIRTELFGDQSPELQSS